MILAKETKESTQSRVGDLGFAFDWCAHNFMRVQ